MRRADREITSREEMLAVLEKCDVCRLALPDGDYPYILPLNFGTEVRDGRLSLYFHGAETGYKYALIEKCGHASFEADRGHELVFDEVKNMCTMAYESVVGRGELVEITEPDEKIRALRLILAHYGREEFPVKAEVAAHTRVLRLDVSEMTGKRRVVRQGA